MKRFTLTVIVQILVLQAIAALEPEFVLKTPAGDLTAVKFSNYYYVSFNLNNPGVYSLISKIPVKTIEISPKSYHIPFSCKDNIIDLDLRKPGSVMVRVNDSLKIFLFAESPETILRGKEVINIVSSYHIDQTGRTNETGKIQKALDELSGSGKTLLFPSGTYQSGQLQIRSNSKIYLARGAVLSADTSSAATFGSKDGPSTKRFIDMNGVENVLISGYGSIDGNGQILRTKFGDEARMRLVLAANSKNIRLEGLILRDPGSWNTQILLCEDIVLKNIKLLNNTSLSNTDGFDPDAVKRMVIDHCFACCSDDNVAIKITATSGLSGNVDEVTVKNCVFLTKKSALKVGTETRGETMKNILFENNDVIECDRGMAIYVSDGTMLGNVRFLNNRFERNHPDQQRKAIHFVVSKRNPDSKLGMIKNVLIKDCIFEQPFPKKSVIKYEGDGMGIEVTIDNLTIAGKRAMTLESAGIEATNSIVHFN